MIESPEQHFVPPLRARENAHFERVFPEVFPTTGDQKVLVLGSGLSNISLQEGVVAVDQRLLNPEEVDFDGFEEVISYVTTNAYMDEIKKNGKNKHLVAANLDANDALPFVKESFDAIVSSNYIFGGLDTMDKPEELKEKIANILSCVAAKGSLYLFPTFVEDPDKLGDYVLTADGMLYQRAHQVQGLALDLLRKDGYVAETTITSKMYNRVPSAYGTTEVKRG